MFTFCSTSATEKFFLGAPWPFPEKWHLGQTREEPRVPRSAGDYSLGLAKNNQILELVVMVAEPCEHSVGTVFTSRPPWIGGSRARGLASRALRGPGAAVLASRTLYWPREFPHLLNWELRLGKWWQWLALDAKVGLGGGGGEAALEN